MIKKIVVVTFLLFIVMGTAFAKQKVVFYFHNNLMLSCSEDNKGCVSLAIIKVPSFCKPEKVPSYFLNNTKRKFTCHINKSTLTNAEDNYFMFERPEFSPPRQAYYKCKIPPNGSVVGLRDKSYCVALVP